MKICSIAFSTVSGGPGGPEVPVHVLNIDDCLTMRSLLSGPDPTFLAEVAAAVPTDMTESDITESYHSDAEGIFLFYYIKSFVHTL